MDKWSTPELIFCFFDKFFVSQDKLDTKIEKIARKSSKKPKKAQKLSSFELLLSFLNDLVDFSSSFALLFVEHH